MTDDTHNQDDPRPVVAAAAAMARLDEALTRSPETARTSVAVATRREAVSVAAIEGVPCRPETFALLLSDPQATDTERSARVALDAHAALRLAGAWGADGPDADAVASAFRASDASSGRLARPDHAWTVDEDARAVAAELSRVAETPEPWTALEAIRRVWTSGRFFGTARRMALVSAPWALARGFGCDLARTGFAHAVRRDPEAFRLASVSQEAWAVLAAGAVASSAAASLAALDEVGATKATIRALCPNERSSSSVSLAVDRFLTHPVSGARAFSEALGLTPRGAKVVLDKLLDAGAIEMEGGARNRRFVCRRAL